MNFSSDDGNRFLPTTADLRDQAANIMKDASYSQLFAKLATPRSPLQKLLLRHPDDLFPKLDPEDALIPPEFSISIPLLLWEVPRTISRERPTRSTIERWQVGSERQSVSDAGGETDEETDETEEPFEQGSFEELVLLNGIRILQHNPHLLSLAKGAEPVTLPQVRKAVGQQGVDLQPVEDEFLRLFGEVADREGIGSLVRTLLTRSGKDTESAYQMKKIASEAYQYVKQLLADVPRLVGEMHRLVPAIARKGAPFLQAHNSFVAWVYGMSPAEYLESLETLWTLQMLHPMVVILTCNSCVDSEGKPLSVVLSSDLSPRELRERPRCGWCGGPTLVQAFYALDGWIQRWIGARDGLLAYGVAYLLERDGLSWQGNVHTARSEHDFHISTAAGDHLVECKVFQRSAPVRQDHSLEEKFRKAITQLVEHMIEIQAASATLACYPDPYVTATLESWISQELERNQVAPGKARVHVIGFDKLPEHLHRLH